ncbi:MAG: class I SAM-dependent methyltransferase [Acidobacteria bacterium]|nr:class I SAM-dependent methyltransferase [Acidobacteriota bacterium]
MVRRLVKQLLGRSGYALFNARKHYASDGLFTYHHDRFRRDPNFRAAYARGVQASQGLDPEIEWRVHVALWAAATALRVPGDFVECGVNAGFISSAIMQYLDWRTAGRRFYLIDTFTGPILAQYSQQEVQHGRVKAAEDAMAAGAYVTDIQRVHANYAEWPNAIVVQGAVPDILPALNIASLAFLHLDLNCASPERAALEFFWNRLSHGAVVLLDDYAYLGHQCQADAIDDLARQLGVAEVLSLPTGQGLIIR